MNPRILTANKLSAAVAAAALMGGAGNAAAVPVGINLDYACELPLVGTETIVADVSSDLPASIGVGEPTGAFDLVADTTIPDGARSGLTLVNTATISGVANAEALLETTGLNLPLTIPLNYPETAVPTASGPFTVVASGSTPSLTFQESQAGTVTISVGNMELVVDTRQSNGNPTGLGEFTAPCELTSENTILHQFDVTTGGGGEPDAPADIAVSPESVDFGTAQLGQSTTETVTITNEGDLDLGINNISLSGANPSDFTLQNNCTTLAGGESCTVDVTFVPGAEGSRSAQLDINSTDEDEANVPVALSGTGEQETIPDTPADIAVSTDSVDFGNTQAGLTKTETVTITNEGDLDLGINSVSISGNDASDFTVNNSCTTLAGGESCTVDVTFAPSTDGARSAQLDIASTDEDEANVAVALSGTGELEPTPEIDVTSDGTDFSAVNIGETANGTITVTNTGNGALSVNNVTVDGDSAFGIDGTACIGAILATDESCTVNVSFNPGSEGDFSGNVTITSDDEDEGSVSVGVSGQGVDPNGGGGNETVVPILLEMVGQTSIAASDSSLPITGVIASELSLPSGNVEASLEIDPTQGTFPVIRFFRKWQATADVTFTQTAMTTGKLEAGNLTTSSEMYINVPKVTIPLFGFDVKIGGGDNCRTAEPVTIDLASVEGTTFSPATGGPVTGTYDLPDLENCGLLTGILTSKIAGPGNVLELDLSVSQ
jgi:hypothetical protein